MVVSLFLVQLFTGIALMTVYSPSTSSAWASVWYIQTQVPGGWLVRGLHHFASDALLITLALYGLLILVTKAYQTPTRFAWWITCGLAALALALSLSGQVLPWDQSGYWGTMVRTNILAKTPIVGDLLRRLLIGGGEMGNLTLTRIHTLHVMVLPMLFAALVVWRGRLLLVRESLLTPATTSPQRSQASILLLAVLVIAMAMTWYHHDVLGDELLAAPADANATDYPARPEWHTLFLHQWLKYFEGSAGLEVVGAIISPALLAMLLLTIPFWGRAWGQRTGHRLALTFSIVVLGGVTWLTYAGVATDQRSASFQKKRGLARAEAARAFELAAQYGIPPTGPLELLANDPMTRGPELFAANCASCHRYEGHDGLGNVPIDPATSSDLAGFATREWIRALLENPMDERFFGRMKKPDGEPAHTKMARFIEEATEEGENGPTLSFDVRSVSAYLEYESVCPGPWDDDAVPVTPCAAWLQFAPDVDGLPFYPAGRRVFMNVCNECHSYDGERSGTTRAPEMLGYGSVAWIERFIADPSHESLYRSRGREPAQMPAFSDRLSQRDRSLIARWLHDSRRPDVNRAPDPAHDLD